MPVLTSEEIRRRLRDRNIRKVAQETNVHAQTIYRLMAGEGDFKESTLHDLTKYLEANP